MKTIYKYSYSLIANLPFTTILPADASILTVNIQPHIPNQIHFWARVDPNADSETSRQFILVGTGHESPDGKYINTLFTPAHEVYHVFEL